MGAAGFSKTCVPFAESHGAALQNTVVLILAAVSNPDLI
jgi:hypothetical protein